MSVSQMWSVEQKREIIAEYEAAVRGTKSAVVQRYGVSMDQVRGWRAARDAGLLEVGLSARGTTRTPKAESAEIARLRAEVLRLREELDRAHQDIADRQQAVEALGKATALLHDLVSGKSDEKPSNPTPPEELK